MLQVFLPLGRDESKVERQEHPMAHPGQWVDYMAITPFNRDYCVFLCTLGNFRIAD